MNKKQVYALYGVAKRDSNEMVLMFFKTKKQRKAFRQDLPGKYRTMTLTGIAYKDFEVELP